MQPKPTCITAHSGAENTPDNSLAFIRLALGLEIEALEVDVRPGAGGHLVMAHDEGEEQAEPLAAAFQLLAEHPDSRPYINCDLKKAGLELAVWELAIQYGLEDRLIFSGSITPSLWEAKPWLAAKTQLYLNMELAVPGIYSHADACIRSPHNLLTLVPSLTRQMTSLHAKCLNMNAALCVQPFLEELHLAGIAVSAWTVNEEPQMRALMDAGIYNLTTRSPLMALRVRRSRMEVNQCQ